MRTAHLSSRCEATFSTGGEFHSKGFSWRCSSRCCTLSNGFCGLCRTERPFQLLFRSQQFPTEFLRIKWLQFQQRSFLEVLIHLTVQWSQRIDMLRHATLPPTLQTIYYPPQDPVVFLFLRSIRWIPYNDFSHRDKATFRTLLETDVWTVPRRCPRTGHSAQGRTSLRLALNALWVLISFYLSFSYISYHLVAFLFYDDAILRCLIQKLTF